MTKPELVKSVAAKAGVTQLVVKDVLAALQDVTFETLKTSGEKIVLMDGVSIVSVDVPEKTYNNPATGEKIVKGAHRAPKAKLGKAIKEAVL